jgi:hypothetical protein
MENSNHIRTIKGFKNKMSGEDSITTLYKYRNDDNLFDITTKYFYYI